MSKGLVFTDIHLGKKSNSLQHLQDCSNFIDWVCDIVNQDDSISHICFLGDWFENRININIFTLDFSFVLATKLNNLRIPIYFIVGNHDLAERNSRNVFSTNNMNALNNFVVISEPTTIESVPGGLLLCPYLLKNEYDTLSEIGKDYKTWMGHFEFKGFVLTGGNVKLEHGPDGSKFHSVKNILSGHFHKRQSSGNIHYIGNTFPMDFGDSGDYKRGCAIYDYNTLTITYKDWDEGPTYLSTTTNKLLTKVDIVPPNCYLYVDVDTPMKYEQLRALRDYIISSNPTLRNVEFNENSKKIVELQQANDAGDDLLTEMEQDDSTSSTVNDIILTLLNNTKIPSYDNVLLSTIFTELK